MSSSLEKRNDNVERYEYMHENADHALQEVVSTSLHPLISNQLPWKYFPHTRQAYTLLLEREMVHNFSKSKSKIERLIVSKYGQFLLRGCSKIE